MAHDFIFTELNVVEMNVIALTDTTARFASEARTVLISQFRDRSAAENAWTLQQRIDRIVAETERLLAHIHVRWDHIPRAFQEQATDTLSRSQFQLDNCKAKYLQEKHGLESNLQRLRRRAKRRPRGQRTLTRMSGIPEELEGLDLSTFSSQSHGQRQGAVQPADRNRILTELEHEMVEVARCFHQSPRLPNIPDLTVVPLNDQECATNEVKQRWSETSVFFAVLGVLTAAGLFTAITVIMVRAMHGHVKTS